MRLSIRYLEDSLRHKKDEFSNNFTIHSKYFWAWPVLEVYFFLRILLTKYITSTSFSRQKFDCFVFK